ncbi:ribonuclease Z [Streptomonospora nanhaiensis]|uniref:Ribonuclease Z n=1 Tax=Streptomonospora nanhaiensis TaxID=1323731 RepID=A0A853BGA5_9ACTN|nr:ribonuclease Z [Streptomonospora nanhaiensis]MBV2363153.1 ribonuclease Z [Streptomonospora nanhaiensis]NYI94353.1 ribonuclease Z [Streptomonospora nanhaiensis]
MSLRELLVLGTAGAVPTPRRNHNGYVLRFDTHGIVFDPGEGTQRQMRLAGLSAHALTRICLTHFHGDHCLGVPGLIQRIARDQVPHPVRVAFPAEGARYFHRLRHATPYTGRPTVIAQPLAGEHPRLEGEHDLTITARPLRHSVPCYGYRVAEPDGWTMLPERLAHHGVTGPDVGRLKAQGHLDTPRGRVELADCARPRRGQAVAFVMDTAPCPQAVDLARGADLLVIESTYLETEAELARAYGHLTAAQAGRIAAQAGVRSLVLTHISERYEAADDARFLAEAAAHFSGPLHLAADLDRIPLPPRR